MMRLTIAFLFLVFATASQAQSSTDIFSAANTAYAEKDYSKAYSDYKNLIADSLISSELFYNFANTAFKQNKLAESVLYFEKAKLLDPNNQNIKNNLSIARESVDTEIIEIPEFLPIRLWKSFSSIFSPVLWFCVQVIFLLSLLYGIYKWRLGELPKVKMKGFILAMVSGSLLIISLLACQTSHDLLFTRSYGIVMSNSILKSAPDTRSDDVKELSEGVKIKVVDAIDNWVKVTLMNKEEGWLEISSIEKI